MTTTVDGDENKLSRQTSKVGKLLPATVAGGSRSNRHSFSSFGGNSFKDRVLNTQLAQCLVGRESPNDLIAKDEGLSRIGNLCDMAHIRTLNIAFNPQLTSLEGVDQLPQLRNLIAYSCDIHNLSSLKEVNKVETIMLQQNRISALTEAFKSLSKLQELRLDQNKITRIENLRSCTSLRRLDLSANRLETLDGISGLQNLEELLVSGNSIKSLLPLRSLPSIREIDVSGNQLKNLDGLRQLPTLEYLNASHNSISQLQIAAPPAQSKQQQQQQQKSTPAGLAAAAANSRSGSSRSGGKATLSTSSNSSTAATSHTAVGSKFAALGSLPDLCLTEIFLAGNRIRSVAGFEVYAHCVDTIDLSNNNLTNTAEVTATLTQFQKLSELRLFGNPCCDDTAAMDVMMRCIAAQCEQLKAIDGFAVVDGNFQRSLTGESTAAAADDKDEDTPSNQASKSKNNRNNSRSGSGTSSATRTVRAAADGVDAGASINSKDTYKKGFHTWEVGAAAEDSLVDNDDGGGSENDSQVNNDDEATLIEEKETAEEEESAVPRPKLVPMLTQEQIIEKETSIRSLLQQCKAVLSSTVFAFADEQLQEELRESEVSPTAGIDTAAEQARAALESHRKQQQQRMGISNANNTVLGRAEQQLQNLEHRKSTTITAPLQRVALNSSSSGSSKKHTPTSAVAGRTFGKQSVAAIAATEEGDSVQESVRNKLVERVRQVVEESDIQKTVLDGTSSTSSLSAAVTTAALPRIEENDATSSVNSPANHSVSNKARSTSSKQSTTTAAAATVVVAVKPERQSAAEAALASAHAQLGSGLSLYGSRVSSNTSITQRLINGGLIPHSFNNSSSSNSSNDRLSATDTAYDSTGDTIITADADVALLNAKITKATAKRAYAEELPSSAALRAPLRATVKPTITTTGTTTTTTASSLAEAGATTTTAKDAKDVDSNSNGDGLGRLRDFDRFERAMFSYGGAAGFDPRAMLSSSERSSTVATSTATAAADTTKAVATEPAQRRGSVPSSIQRSTVDYVATAATAAAESKAPVIVRSYSEPQHEALDSNDNTAAVVITTAKATSITLTASHVTAAEDDYDATAFKLSRPSPRIPPPPSPMSSSVVNLRDYAQLSAPKIQSLLLHPPPPSNAAISTAATLVNTTTATEATSASDAYVNPPQLSQLLLTTSSPSAAGAGAGFVAALEGTGSLSADGSDKRIKSKLNFRIPAAARSAINAQRSDTAAESSNTKQPHQPIICIGSSGNTARVTATTAIAASTAAAARVSSFGGVLRLEGNALEDAVLRASTPRQRIVSSPCSRGQTPTFVAVTSSATTSGAASMDVEATGFPADNRSSSQSRFSPRA